MDRKTRKILTINGMHHPKADVSRLYIKRKNGGGGLLELMSVYKQIIVGIAEYIKIQDGRMMKILAKNDLLKRRCSIHKKLTR